VIAKVSKGYTAVAVVFLNTVLVFVLLNLTLVVYGLFDSEAVAAPPQAIPDSVPLEVYGLGGLQNDLDSLQQVYYYREESEMIWLLLETWNLDRVCDDAARFREGPYQGRYVNVDPAGFRLVDPQAPWPPADDAFNIFVLGGSTTFGYGESDNLTIPSYLQNDLRQALQTDQIAVYNFGRAFYFSLQERWLFESLIADGFVPDLAVFIDGLNDFFLWDGQPANYNACTPPLTPGRRIGNTLTCQPDEYCLPVQRFAYNFLDTEEELVVIEEELPPSDDAPPPDDEAINREVIQRWLENKQRIEDVAAEQGIAVSFVMQPVPAYAYDLSYHVFIEDPATYAENERTHWGYALWEDRFNDPSATWTDNVLNLTRIGEDNQGPIYVDTVHYTFGFMDEIAQAMTDWLIEQSLIAVDR
jgi:hypothetical protein